LYLPYGRITGVEIGLYFGRPAPDADITLMGVLRIGIKYSLPEVGAGRRLVLAIAKGG
jgi:hypothetical protein